ncbi:MAG: hypothetical protein IPM74_10825 [Crocinitomicaceae bacterium]|nr:hypothetical protein [Crocinitomicaceae bacterium]MBK8926382.1 hypothetical protein [Crocinitomicaceae bacterium]
MTIEQAKQKILTTINSDKESVDRYAIDDKNIVDHDFAWYIPFLSKTPSEEIYGGAWNGFFVDKKTEEMFQPGSGLPLERWLVGFKIGLRYDKYDLHIQNIKDKNTSILYLKKLNFQYYTEEREGGTIWKIPKSFSNKMLLERLQSLPTVFRNQRLTFSIDTFEQIIQSGAFEFKLDPNVSSDNTVGENLTRKGSS